MPPEPTEVQLEAIDGGRIGAWLHPSGREGAVGLVLVQEIFGITPHIRALAADYAREGFDVLLPRFFDRIGHGIELACDDAGMQRGRELVAAIGLDAALRDVRAAADTLLGRGLRRVAVIGYCWGGVVAFLAATRLGLPAVSYYGRLVPQFLHEQPQAALLFHFGERDALIPEQDVNRIAARYPQVPLHRYPAGHAFNRLGDPHGEPASAALARERSLRFLRHAG